MTAIPLASPPGEQLPASLEEVCVVACGEVFRDAGEILASAMGSVPRRGARLAQRTFATDIVLSDGEATLIREISGGASLVEGWMPYRAVFTTAWAGQRHVLMGASQLDAHGNSNISCIGDWARPRVQLLGARGAPGNTVNHPTSYWVPKHSPRVFVAAVDMVSGIGTDRARALGAAGRYHHLHRVVSNLGVFDFDNPEGRMRLLSVHPGVSVEEVVAATGFELVLPDEVPETRLPTLLELRLLREEIR